MARDKEKGLIGSTSDQLRETTGVLKGQGPWHSANSDVYHNNANCQTGNSIKAENVLQGTGGKPLCGECEKLNSAGVPLAISPACSKHAPAFNLRSSARSSLRLSLISNATAF